MLIDYAPILALFTLVALFAAISLVFSDLLARKRRSVGKDQPYESGMAPVGDARVRISVHFYLVAVLFIVFDVETIFLIPWAVSAKSFAAQGIGGLVLLQVLIFFVILAIGLVYEWKRGGLDWDR